MWQKQGLVGSQRNQRNCQCQLQAKHSQAHQGWFGKFVLLLNYKSVYLPFKVEELPSNRCSLELYYSTNALLV